MLIPAYKHCRLCTKYTVCKCFAYIFLFSFVIVPLLHFNKTLHPHLVLIPFILTWQVRAFGRVRVIVKFSYSLVFQFITISPKKTLLDWGLFWKFAISQLIHTCQPTELERETLNIYFLEMPQQHIYTSLFAVIHPFSFVITYCRHINNSLHSKLC